ncbi:hypothetical protein ACLUXZ_09700, partial [Limosilactobacillus reuteri subsp. suis]|uniref:hypothetical protein n=1 Tax=Limosilactobacillus reuteri TaxID=1598 RepID=UPI00399105D8
MVKLYMVWDEISNAYFSEVAGVTREENKDNAYIYDKQHATQVLQDVLKVKRAMAKSPDIPDSMKMPVNII